MKVRFVSRTLTVAVAALVAAALAACGGGGGSSSTSGAGTGGGGGTGSCASSTSFGSLTQITVTPATPAISVGATQQFKATGYYWSSLNSSYTTADVTSCASWSTSAGSVATITSAGLATGAGTGQATISAASGTISGSTTVTVGQFTTRLFGQIGASTPLSALVWNGAGYVGVGSGGFFTSGDSRIWNSNINGTAWDLAWDGSLYVAPASSTWFDISTDGQNWTSAYMPASVSTAGISFYGITKSSTTWVAVGSAGTIVYSTNGTTWSAAATVTGTFNGIANYAPALNSVTWTGSKFVAGGASGALATSPDGKTWTLQTSPTTNNITAVSSSGTAGGLVIIASQGTSTTLWSATDATTMTWAASANTMPFLISRIKFAGNQWVAIGGNFSATSPNGTTWTASPVQPIGIMNGFAYNGAEYVGVGSDRGGNSAIYASTDALHWTYRNVMSTLSVAAFNPASGIVAAVGAADTSRTSTDGINWTLTPSAPAPFYDLTWYPASGVFVGLSQVAANQYLYSSPDAKTWTVGAYAPCGGIGSTIIAAPASFVNAGSSLTGPCLATSGNAGATWTTGTSPVPAGQSTTKGFWTGSQFVLLGTAGILATSPNGLTWTTRTTSTTATLNGGVATAAKIVVVGQSGTVLTSADGGVTWVKQASGTTNTLNRVVWTGTQFYAVGAAGTVISSPDAVTWSTVYSPYSSWATTWGAPIPPDFNDAVWLPAANKLAIFGTSGLVATIP